MINFYDDKTWLLSIRHSFFPERERLNLTLPLLNSRPRIIFRYVSGMIFIHTPSRECQWTASCRDACHWKYTSLGSQDLPKQGFCTPRPKRLAEGNLDGRGGSYFSIYPISGQSIVIVFHMSINILMLETVSEGVVIAHIPAATHISFIRRPSSKMLLVKNPFFF